MNEFLQKAWDLVQGALKPSSPHSSIMRRYHDIRTLEELTNWERKARTKKLQPSLETLSFMKKKELLMDAGEVDDTDVVFPEGGLERFLDQCKLEDPESPQP